MEMRLLITSTFYFYCFLSYAQSLEDNYMYKWLSFYPDQAIKLGKHEKIFDFTEVNEPIILQWIDYNQKILKTIETENPSEPRTFKINKRLIRTQVTDELHKWENQEPYKTSLDFYNSIFIDALARTGRADFLNDDEKYHLTIKTWESIAANSIQIPKLLISLNDPNPEGSILTLNGILKRGKEERSALENTIGKVNQEQKIKLDRAIQGLEKAIQHVDTIPQHPAPLVMGRQEYSRRLKSYTDSNITPEELSALALDEIEVTKRLMAELSLEYIKSIYPEQPLTKQGNELIKLALADMEKDVVSNSQEYLEFWEELANQATEFVEEKGIATLPDFPTLQISTAPESAGPAARIGWVASAPPFAPNPVTTLYLPSIPDTLPQQDQTDFWASFNKPFNRMIVIHELIPGHYMQLKISRETPHPVRLVFPYGPYVEGWASFCEKIVLDAGWDADKPLTYLAHLRKRLENANRAYTSVMVHCNGWTQDDVQKFSIETSLLAPQFAKSLWGRLMRSPMQITSYYYGGALFKDLYKREQLRLGDQFDLKGFMDTIMKGGPIPIDEFDNIFSHP